ncbi:hypothetical protein ABTE50_18855, partial [Acinetobacter baumannii]
AVIVQQQTIQLPAIQGITVAAAPLSNLHIKEALVTPEEPKETITFTGLSKQATKTVNQTSPMVAVEEIDKSTLTVKKLFSWKNISKLGF